MTIKFSVIIPSKDRINLVKRAVRSVIDKDVNSNVEIIVVDDGSTDPIEKFDCMREWDKIIRLPENMGGAVARNQGIKCAKGELIYLLDSDDYFINMNFDNDYNTYKPGSIYYTDVRIGNYESKFPSNMSDFEFFDFIFYKYEGIAQTSSLMFFKTDEIYFDESLPKHQDWDLILFSCINRNIHVKKKEGLIFIDRNDNSSISRKFIPSRSIPWIQKVLNSKYGVGIDNYYLELMCKGTIENINFFKFLFKVINFYTKRKITFRKVLVVFYKKIFLK